VGAQGVLGTAPFADSIPNCMNHLVASDLACGSG
jgi:hypothetical protein